MCFIDDLSISHEFISFLPKHIYEANTGPRVVLDIFDALWRCYIGDDYVRNFVVSKISLGDTFGKPSAVLVPSQQSTL